jgi:hypothetical protein
MEQYPVLNALDNVADIVDQLRIQTETILTKQDYSNDAELAFICGLMSKHNILKNRFCSSWSPSQFSSLCKTITFLRVDSLRNILTADQPNKCAYIILRGAVRLLSKVKVYDDGKVVKTVLQVEEDLASGDVVGVEALRGIEVAFHTAQAMTCCDLAVISFTDYDNCLHR